MVRRAGRSRSRGMARTVRYAPVRRQTSPYLPIILVAVAVVAALSVGGFLMRGKISAMLHRAAPTPLATVALETTPTTEESTQPPETPTPEATPTPIIEPGTSDPNEITIKVVGDIMCHKQQLDDAYNKTTGEYDFTGSFSEISAQLQGDLVIGDLDTTISGKELNYSGNPLYNSPESLLTALKKAGFNLMITANSQSFDMGWTGVLKTMENIENAGMLHTGTYRSADEYHEPLITTVKDTQIAVLSYTNKPKEESQIPSDKLDFCIKYINLDNIKKDIQTARDKGADIVLVYMNWGTENTKTASSEMKSNAEKILSYGADAIIGSHPHMLQGITKKDIEREDGTTKPGVVAYSLGNFISNMRDQYNDTGAILTLSYKKNEDGTVSLDKAEYIPTWVYTNDTDKAEDKDFRVIAIGKYLDDPNLLGTLYAKAATRIQQAWNEAVSMLGDQATAVKQ